MVCPQLVISSLSGQGGLAVNVCRKRLRMRQAEPDNVMESTFSNPMATDTSSIVDAMSATVLKAESGDPEEADVFSVSLEQTVSCSIINYRH